MTDQKTLKPWHKKWWAIAFLSFFCLIVIGSLTVNDKSTKKSLNYKIITTEFNKPYKASFDIMLKHEISEVEIEDIANNLKAKNPGYERYFICYYLPDMEID